jgi:AraC-like DNA-binding protein
MEEQEGFRRQLSIRSDLDSYRVFEEQYCDQIFGVDAPTRPPSFLDLDFEVIQIGERRIARVDNRGSPLEVERTPQRVARDRQEAWVVGVCLAGSQNLSFRSGQEITNWPSELTISHSTISHTSVTAPGTRVGVLVIPDTSRPVGAHWSPRVLSGREGLSRILSGTLCTLFEELPVLRDDEILRVTDALLPIISALAAPSPDASELATPSARALQRRRILKFIEAHLGDRALSPSFIASELRMSPRTLHALFADAEMTVGESIWALRLRRCREMIQSAAYAHLSLLEIALECGFADAAHFSRAYRRAFGAAPSDERETWRPPRFRSRPKREKGEQEDP